MFDRQASRLYDVLEQRQRLLLRTLLAVLVLCIAGLFFFRFESSMDDILPKDEVISRTLAFFRNSEVTGKVVISLGLTDPARGTDELFAAADRVAASLDRGLFPEVKTGLSEAAIVEDMDELLDRLPAITSRDDLAGIERRMTRDQISQRLRSTYLQLLKPEGMFLGSLARTDPLGLKGLALQRISALSSAMGYQVTLKNGRFVSRDNRHTMIIAKSTVSVIDTEGSKRMLSSLEGILSTLPGFVSADVIAGHTHSVSNERLIKGDVAFIGVVASIGFLLLYLVIIRDVRTVLIFLVPAAAILISINIAGLLLGSLSYWVLGLGSTVAGITIDYGTHVYFAVSGRSDPGRYVKHVIRPVVFGSITTVAVFGAFFFSRIKGYNEMALFSIICVVLSTALALFVLPHLLVRSGARHSDFVDRAALVLEHGDWSRRSFVIIWVIATAALSWFAFTIEFERDIKRVDGTEQSILDAEQRFHGVWGGKTMPAVLVVAAPDYQQVLELNEQAYGAALRAVGPEQVTSIAPLLPSARTRQENERQWKRFWSPERRLKLRTLLAEEGAVYGFSEQAFEPFFAGLDRGSARTTDAPSALSSRFVQKTDNGFQALTFFPDREELLDAMSGVSSGVPGSYLVSGALLARRIAEDVSADLKVMTVAAFVFVLALTYFAFGNVRETLIAMVPPLTSVIWLLGIMELIGMTVNVANMVAGVLVIGLASDYGIFMVFRSRDDVKAGTILAITLCTLTTVIGAGVLVFAKHPALSSVGVTMVVGVTAGYLASMLVVPYLCGPSSARQAGEVRA